MVAATNTFIGEQMTHKRSGMELPDTVAGRCVFAFVCLFLLPLAVVLCYIMTVTSPAPTTLIGWILHFTVSSVAFGMLLFSFFGLVWAITLAAWAERMLQDGVRKLVLALLIFCAVSFPFVIWASFYV